MYEKNLEKYRDRLFGLIDEDKIICTEIPRPSKEIIDEFYRHAGGLTPTVSDIRRSFSKCFKACYPGQNDYWSGGDTALFVRTQNADTGICRKEQRSYG